MASLRDGLGFDEVQQSGLAGPESNHAYFIGSITSQSAVRGTTFSGTTFTGTNFTSAQGQLTPAGTGSPTTWGLGIQAGSAVASDAPVVVTFGTAWRAAPISIVVTEGISGAQATTAGCVVTGATAGSFLL